jgi:hypothetical protein
MKSGSESGDLKQSIVARPWYAAVCRVYESTVRCDIDRFRPKLR